MNRILAADMWPLLSLDNPNERLKLFLETGGPAFQNLIHSLIIHDEVVIPTQDFLVINVLVGVLGERMLRQCFESGALKLLRVRGSLAYAGSGGKVHGLCSIHTGGHGEPYSASADEALHWAFSGIKETNETLFLKAEIMETVKEVEIGDLLKNTKKDIDRDLSQNIILDKFKSIDITKGMIPDCSPNDIRLYKSPYLKDSFDDVDLVLHTAHTNIEMALAESVNCNSSSTSTPIKSILQAKEEAIVGHPKFYNLCEIASIPDLGRGIVEKTIDFERILKIRNSNEASAFRRWFHDIGNDSDVGKEYIGVLRKEGAVDKLPVKSLRFFLTSLLGVVDPVSGIIAGGADSFLTSKVFSKHKVKYFVESLHELGNTKKK